MTAARFRRPPLAFRQGSPRPGSRMRLLLASIRCFVLGLALSAGLVLGSRMIAPLASMSSPRPVVGPAWTASRGARAPLPRLPVAEEISEALVAVPRLGRGVRAIAGRYTARDGIHYLAGVVLEAPWTKVSAVAMSCTASRFDESPRPASAAEIRGRVAQPPTPLGWPSSPWNRIVR